MSFELERLAAACVFPGFEGLTASDWVRSWLARGLGGVVLFGRNMSGSEQVRALTDELRAERDDVLIGTDEEGGDVTRLEAAGGSSYPGNHALGVLDDVDLTEQVATSIAHDLGAAGIDLNLAPVVDVNSDPHNPVIGIRSFGSEPDLVGRHAVAFVAGTQNSGIAACAKHFPGHGDTAMDSHKELPVVTASLETLHARELVPFRAVIAAGVHVIMTAHVLVPALGEEPATLSREVLTGLLRDELGFEGMALTDALEMSAISGTLSMGEAAVRALAAGADALCLGAAIEARHVEETCGAIVDAVRSGRLAEDRLREAAGRVHDLAQWTSPRRARDVKRTVGAAAAERVVQVEGEVRLAGPPLVLELRPEANVAAGEAAYGFGDALRRRVPETEVMRLEEPPRELAFDDRPLVLVMSDAHRHAWERETAEALLGATDDAVVIETGMPYWRPSGAAAYVVTHGAGRVNLEAAAALLEAGAKGQRA
jgi:beta-N-acetylhexosaminidase